IKWELVMRLCAIVSSTSHALLPQFLKTETEHRKLSLSGFPDPHKKHMSHSPCMLLCVICHFSFKIPVDGPKPQFKPVPKMSLFYAVVHFRIHIPVHFYGIKLPCTWASLQKYHF